MSCNHTTILGTGQQDSHSRTLRFGDIIKALATLFEATGLMQ